MATMHAGFTQLQTIRYKYKLENNNVKNIVKGTPGLIISNGN